MRRLPARPTAGWWPAVDSPAAMEDFSDRRPGVGAGSPAALVEARLRLALEASEMGLWDWVPTTGSLTWDERSAQMYGTLAESSGSIADVDARVHPEDLDHVRAALSGAIEVAGAVDAEFRVVWPDGSTHCPYGRGQALVGRNGTFCSHAVDCLDSTSARASGRSLQMDSRPPSALVPEVLRRRGRLPAEPRRRRSQADPRLR